MTRDTAIDVLDGLDQRLVAALQCDGRLSVERAARVLDVGVRTVRRRWARLREDGTLSVVVPPPVPDLAAVTLLRVRVLRGRLATVAAALAARDDVPMVDVSATGDEISAVAVTGHAPGERLVLEQLPRSSAVTSVTAAAVLHVFRDAYGWRHDVLTAPERAALTPGRPAVPAGELDDVDRRLLSLLAPDARSPAAALAAASGLPDSTVRRRLAALAARGRLATHVLIDARRLGYAVDANLWMRVPPEQLDAAGRALAAHPAVHGALATTGAANLHAAVWLPDLAALYAFVTRDLTGLGIRSVETVLVGEAVKRPGARARYRWS
ncbi:AsnC family transcriptional regulator [Streptomyces sp. SL13]|uniref:AsnC family transcriptional regulator n=1 Tax=Streptantibioticus silvisoli TaxID=2705255 RepID=A0AA90H4M6_9ACTN|nr:AsnC family transcriptional regulator [Streptantibioticus silvisoli]MDI5961820.1 AsnC family transcriptional regulator [Streptantibioticus silvisoli]MDI5973374.1 AsnC family transcriptional regulator [Streptantibioticus silvisoli]